MSRPKKRVGVLISGRGSNMVALAKACQQEDFPAEISLVLSNKSEAQGLDTAKTMELPTDAISHKDFDTREAFEDALSAALQAAKVDYICLAGFMRILEAPFVARWRERLINIHPSLLPSFKGLNTHARALDAGVRFAGCTVHFVEPEMDSGPIIGQSVVPVQSDDDEASLAARILEQEHKLYPTCLRLLCEERLKIRGGRVLIDGMDPPTGALSWPQA